jgi:phospholipase C
MISPLARRGFVGHLQYDHTSILNMIEWRWGLEPLTVRDMTANNLARALDFTKPKDLTAPVIPVGQGPFGVNCDEQVVSRRAEFYALRVMAERFRFRRPH